MKLFKLASLRRLKKDEEGVTVVEYGIALAVALGIAVTAYSGLADKVETQLTDAASLMTGKTQ
ncbi:Flp family type IVb pilin [Thioclava sp. JE_KL1]|uniref:Flp family type IVb pilin n=1 Tax=Thioclava sp. JE_KL1 TaxID=2651187 RepID=UPI00128B6339|nr:Flp family type IVb pilin [Thioclava sp. JE_KL1]MPQ93680.1 Flp family type IVb pilin [Thioclava sp. JE_KL1]